MMLIIDNLSQRYHQLPTAVLASATTFDLAVMTTAQAHAHHLQQQSEFESQLRGPRRPAPKPSQEQMMEMLQKVRSQSNDRNRRKNTR